MVAGRRKRIVSLWAVAVFCLLHTYPFFSHSYGAPFKLPDITIVQPDGCKFVAEWMVDEFGEWVWTSDGFVIQSNKDGFFYYVTAVDGEFVPSDVLAGSRDRLEEAAVHRNLYYELRLADREKAFSVWVGYASFHSEDPPPFYLYGDFDQDRDVDFDDFFLMADRMASGVDESNCGTGYDRTYDGHIGESEFRAFRDNWQFTQLNPTYFWWKD